MSHIHKFYPSIENPQTLEEFEQLHREYWRFVYECRTFRKPEIVCEHPPINRCYACEYAYKQWSMMKDIDFDYCAYCPIKRFRDLSYIYHPCVSSPIWNLMFKECFIEAALDIADLKFTEPKVNEIVNDFKSATTKIGIDRLNKED